MNRNGKETCKQQDAHCIREMMVSPPEKVVGIRSNIGQDIKKKSRQNEIGTNDNGTNVAILDVLFVCNAHTFTHTNTEQKPITDFGEWLQYYR